MWSGEATASILSGPVGFDLDGDGLADAVLLDLDGDGRADDALADADSDGRADQAWRDVDDDGTPEALFGDDGSGTWAVASGPAGTAPGPLRWFGLDGVEHVGTADLDGDGTPERLLDVDADGLADRALGAGQAWVDLDGDGRWDVRLRDDDGDGRADGVAPV